MNVSANTELLDEIERLHHVMLRCAGELNTRAAPDLDPVGVRLREAAWASRNRTLREHANAYLTRMAARCREAAAKLGQPTGDGGS